MKYQHLILLLMFTCSPAFGVQKSTQPKPLQLTHKILSQRHCVGSAEVDFMHLNLQLRYTNVGDRKLILYKGSNLFFTVWVNSNPDQSSSTQYEMKKSSARYFTKGSEDVDRPTPNKDFVVLLPGATYETDVTVSLPVVREKGRYIDGTIGAGEHLLRITVSTWYESKSLGDKLRERWRRKGELWLNPVVSEPIRFSSDRAGSVERCQ